MNININKEVLQKAGEVGLKIGKRIVIEGTKAVILKGTASVIEAKFEGKDVTLDTVLGEDKKQEKKVKKSLFKKKKKVKVGSDSSEEVIIDLDVVEEMIPNEERKGDKSEEA